MNLRDIDLKTSFRYQGIHTIRGTIGSEPLLEGMTNSQAYELMLRNGYGKEGDEPIIPIIRVSYEVVGAGFGYTMDFIATPVISFSSGTKPLTFTLAVPAIPREVSARLEFDAALYGRGRVADNVFIGLVVNANGNISVKYFEN